MKYVLLIVVMAFVLSGCGGSLNSSNSNLTERTIVLNDGRTITCVTYKQGYAGGLSCDWGASSD